MSSIHPVFQLRVIKDARLFSKPIRKILSFYRKNIACLEDEIKSGLDMGTLLEFIHDTRNLEGDILELGTFRGGTSVIFAKFLQQIDSKKMVYCCDTFSGFPYNDSYSDTTTMNAHNSHFIKTSYNRVLQKFEKFGVSDKIMIVKGKFEDTLYNQLGDKRFSFVFSDSDLYDSTKFSLEFTYPRLVKCGIIAFHNYERRGPKIWGETRAVDEFCKTNKIKLETLKPVVYIKRITGQNTFAN